MAPLGRLFHLLTMFVLLSCSNSLRDPASALVDASPLPIAAVTIGELEIFVRSTRNGLEVKLTDALEHKKIVSLLSTPSSLAASIGDPLVSSSRQSTVVRIKIRRGNDVQTIALPYTPRTPGAVPAFRLHFEETVEEGESVWEGVKWRLQETGRKLRQTVQGMRRELKERIELARERARNAWEEVQEKGDHVKGKVLAYFPELSW